MPARPSTAAPNEIADEVTLLVGATEEAANGNTAALDTPEVSAAGETVDAFCGVAP